MMADNFYPAKPGRGTMTVTAYMRAYSTVGGATHQGVFRLPLGQKTFRIRARYINPVAAAAYEVQTHAVGVGRDFNEVEPKNPAGDPITWQVAGALTVPAGPATGTHEVTTAYGPWFTCRGVPEAGDPRWTTVYIRSRNTVAGAGTGRAGISSNVLMNLAAAVAPDFKIRYEYAAAGTTINSSTFTLTSSASLGDGIRNQQAFEFEIDFQEDILNVAWFGDSRMAGQGSTGNGYGCNLRATEALWDAGYKIGFENHSLAGSTQATFQAFAMDRLNQTGMRLPDVAVLQIASTNDTNPYSEQTTTDNIGRLIEFIKRCKQLGVEPVLMLLYPSGAAQTVPQLAQFRRINDYALASGCKCIDFYNSEFFKTNAPIPLLTPSLTADGAHLTDAGHSLADKRVVRPFLYRLLTGMPISKFI